jgi:hypothetical protein
MRLLAMLLALAFAVGVIALASMGHAQNSLVGGLGAGETAGGLGGGIGFGVVAGTVGSAPAPPGCNGVIDLSTGCAMPMLGGL